MSRSIYLIQTLDESGQWVGDTLGDANGPFADEDAAIEAALRLIALGGERTYRIVGPDWTNEPPSVHATIEGPLAS